MLQGYRQLSRGELFQYYDVDDMQIALRLRGCFGEDGPKVGIGQHALGFLTRKEDSKRGDSFSVHYSLESLQYYVRLVGLEPELVRGQNIIW